MSKEFCCICDKEIPGTVKSAGGRYFCEKHYYGMLKDRPGLWKSTILLIAVLVAFAVLIRAIWPSVGKHLTGDGLLLAGIVVAVVPALIWLYIFYLQDRLEPEPKSYVLKVFLLGAVLSKGIGQPFINSFFNINLWAGSSLLLKLLAGVFIVGTVQEFLKYAAVRYTVYTSSEFDERIDGILYGAAAGLGYATMLNLDYIIQNGGVLLSVGAIKVVIVALAHASLSGITGYFMGKDKLEAKGNLWMPLGLLVSIALNGIITVSVDAVSRRGLQFTPLYGLIFSASIALIIFGFLYYTFRKENRMLLDTLAIDTHKTI